MMNTLIAGRKVLWLPKIADSGGKMSKVTIRSVFFRFVMFSTVSLMSVVGFGCVSQSTLSEEALSNGTAEVHLTSSVQITGTVSPVVTEKTNASTPAVSVTPMAVASNTPQPTETPQFVVKVGELDIEGGGPIAITEDGSLIATNGLDADFNEYIYLVDMVSGDTVAAYEKPFAALTGTRSLAFSPDGNYLAAGGNQEFVYVWDVNDGSLIFELPFQDVAVLSVDFSHDGNLIAGCSAGEIGGATIWNILDGSILAFPIPVLAADVEFMPDDSTLAVATIWHEFETQSHDSVLLWDYDEGTLESIFPGEMATSIAVSDNGKLLAVAVDGHLRLWDMLKAEEIEVQEGTLSERVSRIDWSSQGIVAALNSDKSIVLWNENGEFIMHIANEAAEDLLLNSENNLIVSAFNKPLQIFTIPNSAKTFPDD